MTVTATLAEFVASTDFEDLPAEAVQRAKPLLLDYLGVAIGGGRTSVGKIVLDLWRNTESGGDTTVIGADFLTTVSGAAFVNGTLAHALDIDDTAAGTVGHPSAPMLPALFALAEKNSCSGPSLLTAYIVGLEVFYRIAVASEGQMAGWHRSSLFGALATAAAAAKLLNLSPQGIQAAIGIGTSMTGGVQLNFGTMSKAVQVGSASRSGLTAALLARQGCTANPNVLDEPNGFGSTFYSAGRFDTHKIVSGLAAPFNIIFPGMAIKMYPCCGLTHAPADIVIDLVKAHDIAPEQIEEVIVYGEELWPTVLIYERPTTGYEGKYSMQYVVAAAIVDRVIEPATFTDRQVNRPELQAYFERIRLVSRSADEWEGLREHPWNHCSEVVIRLGDGSVLRGEAPCARGYPDLPLTTDEIVDKFRRLSIPAWPGRTIDRIIDQTLSLDTHSDVSGFVRLTRSPLPP